MADEPVLGVDWYRAGWVGVALDPGRPPEALVDAELERLIARAGEPACVAVDMPIGLPAQGVRQADVAARGFVGPRRQSVFMTPPRAVLEAPTYAEANRLAAQLPGGKLISQQAYALLRNIALVAELAERDPRLIEVHPEVSFRELVGEPVAFPKTTWNGQAIRRRALARAGIELPDELGQAGAVPVADLLDAAAAAWSARRHAAGSARSLPEGARRGRRGVIWY